jgi:hypothetical protein
LAGAVWKEFNAKTQRRKDAKLGFTGNAGSRVPTAGGGVSWA